MNESSSPYELTPGAQEELSERLPVHAFESECQRSLEMIELCQRYMTHFVSEKEDPDSHEMHQTLSDLAVATGRLDRNLSNMLALLHCMQHAEKPYWEPVELCSFVAAICSEQAQIQQALGTRLVLDCGGLTELYVHADVRYLTCICLQLLSNALRACTPDGGTITLTLRDDGSGGAVLSIADTGCGLPDGSFRSQQNNRSRFLGTTKSGLLLCQEYCKLTGWTLELRPRASGSGTEALLTIPPKSGTDSSPILRSVSEEDALHAQRRLWFALVFELNCIPGMETVKFDLPAEFT